MLVGSVYCLALIVLGSGVVLGLCVFSCFGVLKCDGCSLIMFHSHCVSVFRECCMAVLLQDTGEVNKGVQQGHLGSVLPAEKWNTGASKVVWSCRWVPGKGLQPIRPLVALTRPLVIPPGKAVELQ